MPIFRNMPARDPEESHRAATQLELFFDLVAVIAIASVTAAFHHAISEGHGVGMILNFAFLFIAIWWAWMNHTWFASAYDNDDALYRVLTLVIMAGYLIFAAGADKIFETLDFGSGVFGWIIMRVGMMLLWLRAAQSDDSRKRTALRQAVGLGFAQTLWVIAYLTIDPSNIMFMVVGCAIFLIEFSIPVWANSAGATTWHRHHIIERYGLLNIIVLGEVLLSLSLMLSKLYSDHFDWALIAAAGSGLMIVFTLWWLYFIEEEHLTSTALKQVFTWGYGHILIYAAGAILAAGLGSYMDVLTHHSHIDAHQSAAFINLPIALYLFALWLVRDRYLGLGVKGTVLLVAAIAFVGMTAIGAAPWYSAALLIVALIVRSPIRRGADRCYTKQE